ncbi:hypothetical protein [Idiomarina sp. HP20-50]|uniref:hypothetical protein n=1 Tax=Idiomarina sp. HP20-50 TaxID=3070813 RepID=UPI00294AC1D0|nr:hypothetical protein [Idiomarina sp. HP20-50]MDV6315859.1 hypothetical protein [Idiomarina sp. HP20-50]
MSDTEQRKRLANRLEQLQRQGIEPPEHLWSGIESRLGQKIPRQSRAQPFWFGALAASVVIATFMTGWQLSTTSSVDKPRPVSEFYLLAQKMNAEQRQQLQMMRAGYETAGYRQLTGDIKTQLAQLASAREKITDSLRNSPGDPNLLELLRWVNEEELKLFSQSYTLRNTVQEI